MHFYDFCPADKVVKDNTEVTDFQVSIAISTSIVMRAADRHP